MQQILMFGLQQGHEYIYLLLCNGCYNEVKNVKITVHDTKTMAWHAFSCK